MAKENCGGCSGTGIQYNNVKGLRVSCPICLGSGKVETDDGKLY